MQSGPGAGPGSDVSVRAGAHSARAGAAPVAHGNSGAGDPQSVGTALHTASSSHRGGKI